MTIDEIAGHIPRAEGISTSALGTCRLITEYTILHEHQLSSVSAFYGRARENAIARFDDFVTTVTRGCSGEDGRYIAAHVSRLKSSLQMGYAHYC